MSIHEADRMRRLPLYLFTIIDDLKAKAIAGGIDVIDLGMGSPDMPTPKHIVDELCKQVRITEHQRYSRSGGEPEKILRRAIAEWYKKKFNVDLNPDNEVLPLIGSKEGVAHLSLTFLNNDDIALVPNPAYPVHFNGVIMAGGILYNIPMAAEDKFKPDLKALSPELIRKAKLLFISYPHNPTTAIADKEFFKEIIAWAKNKPNLIIAHDLAYSDIVFDGFRAPSILEIEGAKDLNIIEFHTLSKSYNMAGWRIGLAVGNKEILASLAKAKSYIDFGIFRAIQLAAAKALTGPQDCVKELVATYKKRRDLFVDGLNSIGWHVEKPKATFYIWARIPEKFSSLTSMEFASLLIEKAGVAVAPGTGFGEYGEGYVRFALVDTEERLKTAIERVGKLFNRSD
jgi:aspartate/methionine/tyrosine aminotransferase